MTILPLFSNNYNQFKKNYLIFHRRHLLSPLSSSSSQLCRRRHSLSSTIVVILLAMSSPSSSQIRCRHPLNSTVLIPRSSHPPLSFILWSHSARVNLTFPDLVNSGVSPDIPRGSYVDSPEIAKKIRLSTVLSLDLWNSQPSIKRLSLRCPPGNTTTLVISIN